MSATKSTSIKLAAGRTLAIRLAPYFATRIKTFTHVEIPGLPTTASTKDGAFLFSDEEIEGRDAPGVAWAYGHEALHLLLGHFTRSNGRNLPRWNLAGCLAINPMLMAMGFRPPANRKARPFPKDYGFKEGLTADDYYILLEQKGVTGEPDPDCSGGFCGSCAGRPIPGEPEGEGLSEGENKRINAQVAREMREHVQKHPGTIPAGLITWSNLVLEPPTVPWEQELRKDVRGIVDSIMGQTHTSYMRPNRRQYGLGTGPGAPIIPSLLGVRADVWVAIDTSGSMGRPESRAVLSEVPGILRAVGAQVTYLACDAKVHTVRKVRSVAEIELKGGGGTDFHPIFEEVSRAKKRPSLVIVCTDGYGPAPILPPRGVRVVWLLIGKSAPKPATWGDVVRVNPKF